MNEPSNEPDEQVEGMLRRWGAARAAEDARLSAHHTQPVAPTGGGWLRTAAVAAVAAAVVGGVAVLATVNVTDGLHQRELSAATVPAQRQITTLRTELALAQGEITRVRNDADKAAADLTTRLIKVEAGQLATAAKADALQGELARQVDKTTALAKQARLHETQIASQKQKAEGVSAELAKANAALAVAQTGARAAKTEASKAAARIEDMRKRLTAAGTELMLVNEKNEKEAVARAQAEQPATRMESVLARTSAPAPDPDGADTLLRPRNAMLWPSRKRIARKARLLVRVGPLRPGAASTQTGRLIDRIEVLLTRLELLNADDPQAVHAFVKLIRSSNVSAEIDSILASTRLSAPVRSWLLEARALLAEDRHVG